MNENAQDEGSSPRTAPGASAQFGGTVAIFFSDIRGFTEHTDEFGDDEAYRIVREQGAIVRSRIKAFGGAVVKTQGDGFMVAFPTARGAILCAIVIQRAVAAANRNQAGPGMGIGIGMNAGEPIRQEDGDYIGGTVNLAARICAAAGPRQILVAESTRYVAGRIELRRSDGGAVEYIDRGLHELKGFPEAKRLFEVTWHPATFGEPTASAEAPSTGEEEFAFKAAVQRANGVLTRVLGIVHLDDSAFPALLECQAKASELRLAFSRAGGDRRGATPKEGLDQILPFENLLTPTLQRETLPEERWAPPHAAVAPGLGRPLVNAAARGRLSTGIGTAEKPGHAAAARERAKEPEPAMGARSAV